MPVFCPRAAFLSDQRVNCIGTEIAAQLAGGVLRSFLEPIHLRCHIAPAPGEEPIGGFFLHSEQVILCIVQLVAER